MSSIQNLRKRPLLLLLLFLVSTIFSCGDSADHKKTYIPNTGNSPDETLALFPENSGGKYLLIVEGLEDYVFRGALKTLFETQFPPNTRLAQPLFIPNLREIVAAPEGYLLEYPLKYFRDTIGNLDFRVTRYDEDPFLSLAADPGSIDIDYMGCVVTGEITEVIIAPMPDNPYQVDISITAGNIKVKTLLCIFAGLHTPQEDGTIVLSLTGRQQGNYKAEKKSH